MTPTENQNQRTKKTAATSTTAPSSTSSDAATAKSTDRTTKRGTAELHGFIVCDPETGEPSFADTNDWGLNIEVAMTRRGAARMLADAEHRGDTYDLRDVTVQLHPFAPDQHRDGDANDAYAAETVTAAKETPHSSEQPRGGSSVDETIAAKLAELTDLYAVYLDDDEDFKRGPVVNDPAGSDRDGVLDIAIGYRNAMHLAGQYADCSPRIVPIRISLDGPGEASTTQRRPAQPASSSTPASDAGEAEGEPDPESEARDFLIDLLLWWRKASRLQDEAPQLFGDTWALDPEWYDAAKQIEQAHHQAFSLLCKATDMLLDGKAEAIVRRLSDDDNETAAPSPDMKLTTPDASDEDQHRSESAAPRLVQSAAMMFDDVLAWTPAGEYPGQNMRGDADESERVDRQPVCNRTSATVADRAEAADEPETPTAANPSRTNLAGAAVSGRANLNARR